MTEEKSKLPTNESLRKELAFALIFESEGSLGSECKRICETNERWGNTCCVDCEYFAKCFPNWKCGREHNCYLRGKKEGNEKWCSLIKNLIEKGRKRREEQDD